MKSLTLQKSIDFKVPTGVLAASLLNDDKQLALGCMDGVYIAELETRSSHRIGTHDSYVSSVVSVPTHRLIVSAGYDGCLSWFDLQSFQKIRTQKVHDFWSWDLAVSPDESMLASVTGQYLAGGYKYEPAPEREPSLKIVGAQTGELMHELEHVPSVQAVAFSHDSRYVAAGNLMGEVRIWDCQSGQQVANWTTDAFTSWGIIKSHCYLGGVFSLMFTPDSNELLLAGMGPMRDPMAGNGRQLWQKWAWKDTPQLTGEIRKEDAGEGLMETLTLHPGGELFAMGGRLRGGQWNVAIFDLSTGQQLATQKTGYRVTEAKFTQDGNRLVLVGSQGQPQPNQERKFGEFGRVEVYKCS